MPYDDFPDEVSLRFRAHVFYVYAQSLLKLMDELAAEGPDNLDDETLKSFDEIVEQTERIWFEAAKLKKKARGYFLLLQA